MDEHAEAVVDKHCVSPCGIACSAVAAFCAVFCLVIVIFPYVSNASIRQAGCRNAAHQPVETVTQYHLPGWRQCFLSAPGDESP